MLLLFCHHLGSPKTWRQWDVQDQMQTLMDYQIHWKCIVMEISPQIALGWSQTVFLQLGIHLPNVWFWPAHIYPWNQLDLQVLSQENFLVSSEPNFLADLCPLCPPARSLAVPHAELPAPFPGSVPSAVPGLGGRAARQPGPCQAQHSRAGASSQPSLPLGGTRSHLIEHKLAFCSSAILL